MTIPDEQLHARVAEIIAHATASLDPEDFAERVAWCREHNAHGTRMHLSDDDDMIELRWGNKPLVMVPRSVLLDERPLPEPTFIAEPTDTFPDEWTER